MTTYNAPIRGMNFVINELAGLGDVNKLPGFEEATPDLYMDSPVLQAIYPH